MHVQLYNNSCYIKRINTLGVYLKNTNNKDCNKHIRSVYKGMVLKFSIDSTFLDRYKSAKVAYTCPQKLMIIRFH